VPILRTIADLTTRIVEFERRIEQIATERYPERAEASPPKANDGQDTESSQANWQPKGSW